MDLRKAMEKQQKGFGTTTEEIIETPVVVVKEEVKEEVAMSRNCDIIDIKLNVNKKNMEEFLKGEIKNIPFELALKEFDAGKEMDRLPEADRDAAEGIIKKIVAYGADESYLNVVPAILVPSEYLKEKVADMNIAMLGRDVERTSLAKIKSQYVVPHIVEKTNRVSEVYLDTATLIVHCALDLLGGVLPKDKVLSRANPYNIALAYNGDGGYTISFTNKYFQEQ